MIVLRIWNLCDVLSLSDKRKKVLYGYGIDHIMYDNRAISY
jgi:hypothetical protein